MAIDEKYQSDHLMLLVGSNPLPNAVAGRLLTRPGGEITLFHTPDSATVAKNLRIWLESKGQNVSCQVEIQDESDPVEIYGRVISHLNSKMPVNTGLHYTGGTKAMAVHSWQAVEQWQWAVGSGHRKTGLIRRHGATSTQGHWRSSSIHQTPGLTHYNFK